MAHDPLAALVTRVAARLADRGYKLVTAESCTGGWVAEAMTSISGSSAWFERGFVTYSDESKVELLGVRPETLARYGAVSEETAREMAAGALERSRAQIAVAITGIAGPTGGTPEKPVGMVCFAWAQLAGVSDGTRRQFGGDRESVRRQSVFTALEGLFERLAT
jgi:nicotinamide-nucleotide amidase